MKYCYAYRRNTLYPNINERGSSDPNAFSDAFVGKVADMGFDSLEIGSEVFESFGDDHTSLKAFGKRLSDAGVPVAAIRSGGSFTAAKHAGATAVRKTRMIEIAAAVGATVINGSLGAPQRYPGKPGNSSGWYRAQDASRDAMIYDYERLAGELRKASDQAANHGVAICVEVHQNSPVDNSWSAKLLHELVDRPNFGFNPDLGNIFWTYDVPEESTDDAIAALAPISVYWHCKNLHRVHHPENERAVFVRVPLQDGEIDYRFAISAMVAANYSGYMAIEGAQAGDQFYQDTKSIEYARSIVAELDG